MESFDTNNNNDNTDANTTNAINEASRDLPRHYKLLLNEEMVTYAVDKCAFQIINERFLEFHNILMLADYRKKENKPIDLVFLCVLKGGAFFAIDLMRKMQEIICTQHISHEFNISINFITSSSYGNHQNQSSVKISGDLDIGSLTNKKIIIVDELMDNGTTIFEIKKHLVNQGLEELNIFSCVAFMKDKPRITEPNWFGLMVPDVWLIGYGLDDQGKYRELQEVYYVNKPDCVEKTKDDILFGVENYEQIVKEYYEQIVKEYYKDIDFKN